VVGQSVRKSDARTTFMNVGTNARNWSPVDLVVLDPEPAQRAAA
jgi:hypothetical protein